MRLKLALAGGAALLCIVPGFASAATLVQYNFNGNVGNEVFEPASFAAANLTGLNMTRGSGQNAPSGADSFSSAGWGAYTANPNDYLTFGFNALAGYTATVNQLVFSSRSSNTGPGNLAVLAAVNGAGFQQIATFSQTNDSAVDRMLSFAPLTGVTDVIFRIVASSGTAANGGTLATGGTFRLQNYGGTPASPFTISGDILPVSVSAVPEPANWAMMITGFGLIGGASRRRKAKVTTSVAFA